MSKDSSTQQAKADVQAGRGMADTNGWNAQDRQTYEATYKQEQERQRKK